MIFVVLTITLSWPDLIITTLEVNEMFKNSQIEFLTVHFLGYFTTVSEIQNAVINLIKCLTNKQYMIWLMSRASLN